MFLYAFSELSFESNDAKSTIKNIRRHVRLLNQKWLELHNKSERWQNQLASSLSNLEAIDNLNKLSSRTINEIESAKLNWKNVSVIVEINEDQAHLDASK